MVGDSEPLVDILLSLLLLLIGAWDPIKNRHIDYVPFPSTIFMEGDTLHLSFGWQDHLGCTAKMKLNALLDTLVPV